MAKPIVVPDHALTQPAPPERLDEDEAQLWTEIVDSLPPEWFSNANLALLEAYCHSIIILRTIDSKSRAALAKIKQSPAVELWDELTLIERCRTLAKAEAGTAANLATKMRLTQQSRMSNEKGTPSKGGKKPWEA